LRYLKQQMNLTCIRHTPLTNQMVRKVAVCGGAGSFLLPQTIRQGVQVFVSADFKYHEFFDADGRILVADIGHYESEVFTKEQIGEYLSQKFSNIALLLSNIDTNPVHYL